MNPEAVVLNPFSDPNSRELWELAIRADIDAFVTGDWELCARTFDCDRFMGIDAKFSLQPDDWRLSYPSLQSYQTEWVAQSRAFSAKQYESDVRNFLFGAIKVRDIEYRGESALVHKHFEGALGICGGGSLVLNWRSIFFARRTDEAWKLTGFVGYLPGHHSSNESANRPFSR